MKKQMLFFSLLILSGITAALGAEDFNTPAVDKAGIVNGNSDGGASAGPGKTLPERGIELNVGATNIYQHNAHGGVSTHRARGRFSGSYDIELTADLRKLLGLEGGTIFMHGEGGWPDAEGIDGVSVGSQFGVNADAIGNRAMDIVELYYEGPLFSEDLTVMIGKLDFTGIFDGSAYADDECSQFLNGAFVDNPAIPFGDYGLGVVLTYEIADRWYVSGGVVDAQADGRETGFSTAFNDEDFYLYILESGVTVEVDGPKGALAGNYRVGLWYDPQDKAYFSNANKTKRDDTGCYVSCDQLVYRENDESDDNQGLGVFGRYGWSGSETGPAITNFWSMGVQYEGLFEGRDEDVLGIGFAHGTFTDRDKVTFAQDYESVVELYYNARITSRLSAGPDIQYVKNPGGSQNAKDSFIIGVRAQMTF